MKYFKFFVCYFIILFFGFCSKPGDQINNVKTTGITKEETAGIRSVNRDNSRKTNLTIPYGVNKNKDDKTTQQSYENNEFGRGIEYDFNGNKYKGWISVSDEKGGRDYTEDRFEILEEKDIKLFGVYDGHGNEKVSEWLSKNFLREVSAIIKKYSLPNDENRIREEIFSLFLRIDKFLCNKFPKGGSTVIIVVIYQGYFIFINLGDSGALLYSDDKKEIFKTKDHKPSDDDEKARIHNSKGGRLFFHYPIWRVRSEFHGGGLGVARALGDNNLKIDVNRNYNSKDPPVSAIPDLKFKKMENSSYSLLLASDGVWDNIKPEMIINDPELENKQTANIITDRAYSVNGVASDNITALFVTLKGKNKKRC